MKTARVETSAPSEADFPSSFAPDVGATRAAGVLNDRTMMDRMRDHLADHITKPVGYYRPIDDDSDFEGRETYQDDIEDISPFTIAEGDDDELFVIEMSQKKGCLRCGATFFARGKCLQCGADDPGKQIMGCG